MKIYIAKQGDTLYTLAKKYGITLEELIAMNSQLANPDKLDIGMKIKVPSTPTPSTNYEIVHKHVVKEGDTLWKLSKAWGVPLQTLIDANPQLKNPNVLVIGQIVNIPGIHHVANNIPDPNQQAPKANLNMPKAEINKPKMEVKQPKVENLQPIQVPNKLKVEIIKPKKEKESLYKLEKIGITSSPPTPSTQGNQQPCIPQSIYHQPNMTYSNINQPNMVHPNINQPNMIHSHTNQPYHFSIPTCPSNIEAPIQHPINYSCCTVPMCCEPMYPPVADVCFPPIPPVFGGVSSGVTNFIPCVPFAVPIAPSCEHSCGHKVEHSPNSQYGPQKCTAHHAYINQSYYEPMPYGNHMPGMPNAFYNSHYNQSLNPCGCGCKDKRTAADENKNLEAAKKEGQTSSVTDNENTKAEIKNMEHKDKNKIKISNKKKVKKKRVKVSSEARPWINK